MSRVVRFGLIGAGRWGKNYIKTLAALPQRCRLTHLATSRPENASLIGHPVEVVPDWRRLVAADCEAVIISSPSSTHAEMVDACLQARKPCIVEKPFCLDLPTAERLCARVAASKVPVLVEYTQLFHPAYQALKRRLQQTREPIRLILSEGMSLGPFRGDEAALWDWGPHEMGLCLDLLGRMPQRVEALAGPRDPKGVPEQVGLRLDFSGGTSAWIQAGYLSPYKRRNLSVFTEEQVYLFDDTASERLTVAPCRFPQRYEGGAAFPLQQHPLPVESSAPPLTNAVAYFLDALNGGDRRLLDMTLTLQITQILAECEAIFARRS
ncbi:MAG: Gfo/Idh/MocA family oxidoreductase [Candidatus Omnitrophica bacterium]|nr:Gfo/Idh/MocA family oxidoreductase [Candidatus Omnitrophota bacterium]